MKGNDVGDVGSGLLLFRFARTFVRPHAASSIGIALLVVAGALLQLPVPLLTIRVIDRVIPSASILSLNEIIFLLTMCVLAKYSASGINELMTLHLKEKIILAIQLAQIRHLQRLPLGFFTNRHSVYLQSRVMNDARTVDAALVKTFASMLVDGSTLLVGLGLVFAIRYQLALALCMFIVPFGIVRYYANDRMRSLSRTMQELQALGSSVMAESFAAIRTIKAYRRERFQERVVEQHLNRLKLMYLKTNWFAILANVGTSFCSSGATVFVLWYGATAVMQNRMTLGEVVAILSFLNLLYGPINSLVAANFRFQQSITALQRVYEFLDEPAERRGGKGLAQPIRGKIEFRNVTFAYPGGPLVLRNVSFVIPAGATVALVGPTGAGKSTIVNLLLGFYEPTEGQILIDDQNICELSLDEIRETTGLVDQQPFLFSGSILANVRFAKPDASFEQVVEACRLSYSEEFIERLPDRYETGVGERGVSLSGGQCQRIALARMFLKEPAILILDEAISSVDSESERYIQAAIKPLVAERTTIFIAHRLSSLALATTVFVLDRGAILEQGTHELLLGKNGRYAELFREQITGSPALEQLSLV